MDLEGIMLSEINKKVRHIQFALTYMWNLNTHTHIHTHAHTHTHTHTHTQTKFIEKEIRYWLPEVRRRGRGTGKKVVKRYKLAVIR